MRAPEWTGSAGYRHDFALANGATISASADVQFSSSYYLSVDFLESARQSSFAVGNFDLTYTSSDKRLSVSGFVSNIWNEAVYTQAFRYPFVTPGNPLANPDGVILGTLRPPRTFGGRVRVNF
jgi:iron complex outermembrane receptor protein